MFCSWLKHRVLRLGPPLCCRPSWSPIYLTKPANFEMCHGCKGLVVAAGQQIAFPSLRVEACLHECGGCPGGAFVVPPDVVRVLFSLPALSR